MKDVLLLLFIRLAFSQFSVKNIWNTNSNHFQINPVGYQICSRILLHPQLCISVLASAFLC